MPSNSRFKCYFGCENDEPLHHFPKPVLEHIEKFKLWKNVLDDAMQLKDDLYIYNQIRICSRHFEKYYCSSSNRLTANAVPTLFINALSQQHSSGQDNAMEPSTSGLCSMRQPRECSLTQSQSALDQPSVLLQPVGKQCNDQELMIEQPSTSKSIKTKTQMRKKKPVSGTPKTTTQQVAAEKFATSLQNKIEKLTKKCRNLHQKLILSKKLSKTPKFIRTIESMPEAMKCLIMMQMKWKKCPRGRRFSLEEKIMSLTILKQSQKAYNFLRKLFVLPSQRCLLNLLSKFTLNPGINSQIMENLKKTAAKLRVEKRLCVLLFDEVSLSPGLYYNKIKSEISGFEDSGNKKTQKIADHALVFMIKSLKTRSKQPICFTFCQSATKKTDLKELIKLVVTELQKAGITIVATICDQAAANVGAIKLLKKETETEYLKKNERIHTNSFEIEGMKIFPLFDTPHLLKGVRNNLIKKNLKYVENGKERMAKWEHLQMLLDIDPGEDEIRFVNKLTEYHLNEKKLNKMKVKLAAQVFSQRVSSALRFLARHKILPDECNDTADLLLLFDKLFDSFNGHTYHNTKKVLKGCLKNNSPHFKFWREILPVLETMVFKTIKKNPNGTENISYQKVPSIQNWIHNIKTFIEMWHYLNEKHNIKNIVMRNLNQDPLENFFSCIRSNGVRNVNPTCLQFSNAFKTLLINNFDSPHSITANCERDNNHSMQSLKCLLIMDNNEFKRTDFACEIDSLITTMETMKSNYLIQRVHVESKKYVAGYIIKKCKTKVYKNCIHCKNDLCRSEVDVDSFNYEIDYTKKSLFHACDAFIDLLNEIYFMIVTCLRESPEINFINEKIIFFIKCKCDFDSVFKCKTHKNDLIDFVIKLSMNIVVNSWCAGVNRILCGKISKFDHSDSIKRQAFNYFLKHKKK